MRNYIILNDKNSNEITGLLISTLPPISKPKIRTTIEEIDGRDGDIVTKLGYSAYDKELQIGLYGDFDINEVISYFDSEGTIVFSNEPDKYYNYEIFEQIDFEKLIRFKTAQVKMHVQPFKYSSVESTRTFNITNETEISITNNGNYFSKPVITITGTGTINLNINGYQVLVIDLSESNEVAIDTENMEAYNPTTKSLMNRQITGDYNDLNLKVGTNTISWSGTITEISIENYSRWL